MINRVSFKWWRDSPVHSSWFSSSLVPIQILDTWFILVGVEWSLKTHKNGRCQWFDQVPAGDVEELVAGVQEQEIHLLDHRPSPPIHRPARPVPSLHTPRTNRPSDLSPCGSGPSSVSMHSMGHNVSIYSGEPPTSCTQSHCSRRCIGFRHRYAIDSDWHWVTIKCSRNTEQLYLLHRNYINTVSINYILLNQG